VSEPSPAWEEPSDDEIRELLADARTIAVVGLSSKPDRASFEVSEFLQRWGYRIVPINPNETEVLGEPAYPTLLDVPDDITIDVVDVFRRPEHTPPIAEQSVARHAKMLWLQDGIVNEDARRIAADAGITVVMDDCIKRNVRRLLPPTSGG
jgi:predicted CoA-binding protein